MITYCPVYVAVTVPVGSNSATVGWTEPRATDESGIDPRLVSRTHAPNSNFAVGTHTVTYTFADESLNTASCHFDVIVTNASK